MAGPEIPNPKWDYHMYISYSKPRLVHDHILLYELGCFYLENQNPWTGLRGQFYDHLREQTSRVYRCCAAEPINVQFTLSTYFMEVVNMTVMNIRNRYPTSSGEIFF
ncbi:mannosylglycoprotein endo-beta-mannosidase, partial [Striga asiatica]